jgi:hypothetical protein
MGERLIISVHVQKPAGTSLALTPPRCSNRWLIHDYQYYSEAQETSPEVKQSAGFSRNHLVAKHRRSDASRYVPGPAFTATLGHPLDGVVSQFCHELNRDASYACCHQDIVSGRTNIGGFARQDAIGDTMPAHLIGQGPRDSHALPGSEHLPQSRGLSSRGVPPLWLEAHVALLR